MGKTAGEPVRNSRPRPVMRYHGGKYRIAPWIISYFPPHETYVEPFGGAASALFCKDRSRNEVYNDIDDEVVNVFRVLRDPLLSMELARKLEFTPFSRTEFESSYQSANDSVEQARHTILRSFMGHGGDAATRNRRNGFRSRRAGGQSPAKEWMTYPPHVLLFAERMRGVTIENRPAIDVMRRYDSPSTLHYADPPYLMETRSYGKAYRHEMTDDDHLELIKCLKSLEGMVIFSGYPSPLYKALLRDWRTVTRESAAENHTTRTECLWLSPRTVEATRQKALWMATEEAAS